MEQVPRITAVGDEINGDMVDNQRTDQTEVRTKIDTVMSSVLRVIRQPPGECDLDSDVPCSCSCVDGYHGIELEEADRHKTTFATEWGKLRYKRASEGYLSSGYSYIKHTDAIIDDCPSTTPDRDFEKIVDDIT